MGTPIATVAPSGVILRLALFYIASFAVAGTVMPSWQVWLHERGLSAPEIGLLIATGILGGWCLLARSSGWILVLILLALAGRASVSFALPSDRRSGHASIVSAAVALLGDRRLQWLLLAAALTQASHVPPGLAATAQRLYGALAWGIAFGLTMPIAGLLYATDPGTAFFVMAAMCAAAAAALMLIERKRQ
ncbi:MAG: hypothetical protein ACREEE_13525 [Dongiaceae bacterium]